ncbi:MAG TPA: methionine adenosyltransferase [Planctomycetota bacterium]|nr:methionine adenosyltransferase [Planctomycetota bacterium]OQC20063.1 MAG: S-adenosylmethionine synthase [Planctomycetes bacterium ADurb.Bin069]NMD36078.1 methionine adenosyltransferase [Planctomycetota bacterium]HNR98684.1 methionine adenosyltransferase [Planctomycetota bacterium]HNU25064.1 methionine adenosyltransferase [Planctomycetota bacterium]
MGRRKLATSESVTMGHPDKMADQVSDAILDAIIAQDTDARVACECMVTTGLALVAGEITTKCYVDIPDVVRKTIREIGYTGAAMGFDADSCAVMTTIDRQSPDIAQGINGTGLHKEQGAGDQGIMYGYACDETPEFMPTPILLAQKLCEELARARKEREIPYLRPDGKSQVTVEYDGDQVARVHTVVISTQHSVDVDYETIRRDMVERVAKKIIPAKLLDADTRYHVNPTGRFVTGGPASDCGLTGRKIIVDTYGGIVRHGGGAFSGKDPTKVDRSAAYMARYIAKNIVAARVARRCEVQLAYAIGIAKPLAVTVEAYGTAAVPEQEIEKAVWELFDMTPRGIISALNLLRPIYRQTACHGHFGRNNPDFTWEATDKAAELRKLLAVRG